MSKQTGLGDNLYVAGVDLSGDAGSIGNVGGGPAAIEVPGIDKSAMERIGGRRDGRLEWSAWFNPSRAHPELSALPTTDIPVTYCRGTARGAPAASLFAKQVNYDPTRGQDGSISFAVQELASGYGVEWGRLLTAGKDTLSGAGAGASIDDLADTDYGLQAYLHVFAFTGTSATIAVQHSSDDGGGDAFADVATFSAVSTSPAWARLSTANTTTVERYLRFNVTGTFTNLEFALAVVKNPVAGVVF